MNRIFVLIITFFCASGFSSEMAEINVALNIYRCSENFCLTPIVKGDPVVIQLTVNSGSQVMRGQYELKKQVQDLGIIANIQLIKVLSGPNQGYIVQAFLTTDRIGHAINSSQLGSVLVDNLGNLNLTNWKLKFSEGDEQYVSIITVGPKTNSVR